MDLLNDVKRIIRHIMKHFVEGEAGFVVISPWNVNDSSDIADRYSQYG